MPGIAGECIANIILTETSLCSSKYPVSFNKSNIDIALVMKLPWYCYYLCSYIYPLFLCFLWG